MPPLPPESAVGTSTRKTPSKHRNSHCHRTTLGGWRGSDCRARCPALGAEAGYRRGGAGREGQQVRLVCIPRFCDSGVLVLVNLDTLHVHPITFNASMGA